MPDDLSSLAPTTRFADRAGDYVKHRPGYPPEAALAALQGLDHAAITIADIGAGTGISSRWLATQLSGSSTVIAIEPNDAMRDAGAADQAHPASSSRIRWHAGTGEATGLADRSVDLVVCAQAFHWFRPPDALTEFARILKPRGRVALVWNDRDNDDPLTASYGEAIRRASDNHPAEKRFDQYAPLEADPRFVNFCVRRFPNAQSHDLAGLIGRARSASYVPKGGPKWDALVTDLTSAFNAHRDGAGVVTLQYITSVYLADKNC